MEEKSVDAADVPTDPETVKSAGRRKVITLVVGLTVLGVILLTCLGIVAQLTAVGLIINNGQSVREAALELTSKPVYNQITFVGNDGNIWLVAPDGTGLRSITDDGPGYVFPTWAPDGRYLAFIGPDEEDNSALYVTPVGRTDPTILFHSPTASPFYLYWSPDSKTITFLTQERSGLAMRQAAPNDPGDQRLLGMGSPFYWVWSPQGDRLLMHVGGSRAYSEKAHISVLPNQDQAIRIELGLAPGKFQAPVWSADGQYFFYVASNEAGTESIYKTNADTLEQQIVTSLDGFSFMTLSPNGDQIAYLQIESDDRPPFGTAYLVNTDGSERELLLDRRVGSMYWSPDGTKLALLTFSLGNKDGETAKAGGLAAPLPQQAFLRWWIYDVETDVLEPLITFSPTIDFLQTIPYFDQYHLSLTFWSPDSRYLVVTKAQSGSRDGTVWVVDTTGEEEPNQIGEGRLAVWSWQ